MVRRLAHAIPLSSAGAVLAGTLVAAPVLAGFADLAAPLLGGRAGSGLLDLPWSVLPWADLALLPPAAALIGWLTAQLTLRRWLRRLP